MTHASSECYVTRSLKALVALLCTTMLAASPATAAQWGISGDLMQQMRFAGADDRLPVMIVMAEQADPQTLLPAARSLDRESRRAFGIAELQYVAERTQGDVRAYLEQQATLGQAAQVRPLWIGNGILAELTPDAIYGLLDYGEIRTVLWDPPIPEEQSNDTGEEIDQPSSQLAEIWQLESVNAPAVWALGFEGEGIIIAVEDSGVWRAHGDLASHIWNNDDEIPGNGVDDDSNGYVDDTWGWDFESNDNDPNPTTSDHGTKCSGIAAGDGTEGTRTGVAPKALIMGCKVSSWGQNIEGIQYAIDNGAHIITMSRSQKWRFSPKPDYDWWRSITDGELLTGIMHANSIGNEGDNTNTDPIPFNIAAPGCCPTPWRHPDQVQAGVSGITSGCGALDQNNIIASYSSLGPFAWEDIRLNWPEYPHTMRPEYQDYPYSGGLPGLLKPDVIAPGPGTLSINIGGGYGSFSGTSAATPHVAGGMALILSANPFLTPEQMGMVLQSNTVDLGPPGKDNVYGAGKLDCLASVLLALQMNDFGFVAGTVTDASTSAPIAGIEIEAVGTSFGTSTSDTGEYNLPLPPGLQTLRFTDFYYEEATENVLIETGQTATLDVALTPKPASSVAGMVTVGGHEAPVRGAEVVIENTPIPTELTGIDGSFEFQGVPVGTYALSAQAFGFQPAQVGIQVVEGTPLVQNLALTPALLALDMESDPSWQAGVPGDNATTGIWVRVDPNGTAAQPEDDHTPDPGVLCFVTGQGSPSGTLGENDVDNGTTTLRTGILDLSSAPDPVISYWAWYSNNQGSTIDDEWVVQISEDGGTSWVDLVRTSSSTSGWEQFEHRVLDFVAQTNQIVVQFIASDLGGGSIVEAAVDDFQIFGQAATTGIDVTDAADSPRTTAVRLAQNQPNPFNPETTIRYALDQSGAVKLRVFDVAGRHVRTLVDAPNQQAGAYEVRWDGRDALGREVASGVFYYRLESGDRVETRRMVLLK